MFFLHRLGFGPPGGRHPGNLEFPHPLASGRQWAAGFATLARRLEVPEVWLGDKRFRLSRLADEPIDYMLRRHHLPASSMTDGFCLSNNAAERALRGFALGRRS